MLNTNFTQVVPPGLVIYDKPSYLDRYTVFPFLDRSESEACAFLACSTGGAIISEWGEVSIAALPRIKAGRASFLGIPVAFDALDEGTRCHILDRLAS